MSSRNWASGLLPISSSRVISWTTSFAHSMRRRLSTLQRSSVPPFSGRDAHSSVSIPISTTSFLSFTSARRGVLAEPSGGAERAFRRADLVLGFLIALFPIRSGAVGRVAHLDVRRLDQPPKVLRDHCQCLRRRWHNPAVRAVRPSIQLPESNGVLAHPPAALHTSGGVCRRRERRTRACCQRGRGRRLGVGCAHRPASVADGEAFGDRMSRTDARMKYHHASGHWSRSRHVYRPM